ncbi:carbonic anhydrase [Collybia nuda]|uniref:Carbonic anhydrase n=1 Tax=Collybia nuda TaxID=64659 RepID=A0A9P5YG14_9AGAR|nr:carbonic anhydrase [Collybia nuda]
MVCLLVLAISTLLVPFAVFAHPIYSHGSSTHIHRRETPELDILFEGNRQFRSSIEGSDPGLLKKLSDDGQAPPFMFIGCSDSRASEGTIFNAKPGTFFTERNIANQFHSTDANSLTVLSYAVSVLGVKHVVVMGHYGCGGVAAAIATPPSAPVDAANGAVQNWIDPIRDLFRTSTRPEIVELRERNRNLTVVEESDIKEPGFRALVEENVKENVRRIASDTVISNHYALLATGTNSTAKRADHHGGPPAEVFIHGWIYDIENGQITDLAVSTGPPGVPIPPTPFAAGIKPAEASVKTTRASCEQLCKVKRSLLGKLPW